MTLDELKDALTHLNDLSYLDMHPLAGLLPDDRGKAEVGSPGLRLRALLLRAIDSLKPDNPAPKATAEWRAHVLLHDRYVLRRRLWDIANQLSLSERQVRREHQRALQSVNAFLQARIREGPADALPANLHDAIRRLAPAPRVFSISELTSELAEVVERMTQAQDIPVRWEISPPHLTVYADRGVVHQLLLRLLQLFLHDRSDPKASGRTLTVSATEDPSTKRVLLAIEGEADSQASNKISETSGAYKERLRLCQWLARVLNTELVFSSDVTATAQRAAFMLPAGASLPIVFIVDDEPMAIELFRGYLAGLNYRLVAETKPERALQRALETKPDVIVLDVMMPEMDGWELFQRLRHEPQLHDVPIVVSSVLNDQDMASALGATRFLKKPILRQQFVQLLKELLSHH